MLKIEQRISYLSKPEARIRPTAAVEATRLLLSQYVSRDMPVPELFVETVTALFCEYAPENVFKSVKAVLGRCKFQPTIAEIKEELDKDDQKKGQEIRILRDELERLTFKENEKQYDNFDPEKRKQQVEQLLKGFKPKDLVQAGYNKGNDAVRKLDIRGKENQLAIEALQTGIKCIESAGLEFNSIAPTLDALHQMREALDFLDPKPLQAAE